MEDQVSLFGSSDGESRKRTRAERVRTINIKRPRRTIEERCEEFDRKHPEVYAEIRRLAIEAHQQGRKRIGIGHLVEVARWNLETNARDVDGFKANNDYRSIWVRKLVQEIPALAPMFELRERRSK